MTLKNNNDEWIPIDVNGSFSFNFQDRLILGMLPNYSNTEFILFYNADIIEYWCKALYHISLDELFDELFNDEPPKGAILWKMQQ